MCDMNDLFVNCTYWQTGTAKRANSLIARAPSILQNGKFVVHRMQKFSRVHTCNLSICVDST